MDKSKADQLKEQLEEKYDKFVEKFQQIFQESREKTTETMEKAMDKAHEQLTQAGEFTSEQGKTFKDSLMRDLKQATYQAKLFGEEAKEYLDPERLKTGALASLSNLLHKAGDALDFLKEKTDQVLIYKTGEITTAGSLTCLKCDKKLQLKKTGHVPPCPACKGTEFKKGY